MSCFRVSLIEEYKENINTFTHQIEDKKNIIQQLEQTKQVNENSTHDEQKSLETRLFNLKQKLENEREKLKSIDQMLSSKSPPRSAEENNSASKFSAFDDSVSSFDRNSNLMSKSFNENMFFNRNKIEVSHFDFNLCLDNDDKVDEKVLNNVVDAKITTANHTSTRNNQLADPESSNNASPHMMPKFASLSSINSAQDNSNNKSRKANGGTSNGGVVQRPIPKHKRPLTRYLPNFSLDFNLRQHIETAGHQVHICPHVIIDGNRVCFIN